MDVHPKSQMLTPGQVLRSYILKPLRKDLTSIMSFILSLLIFGGQNVHECVQTSMSNLCRPPKGDKIINGDQRSDFESGSSD